MIGNIAYDGGEYMETVKTCCITGHRRIQPEHFQQITRSLRTQVMLALVDGYRRFISGFAVGTDLAFAEAVIHYRETEYPDIILEAAIPHPGRMRTKDETFQRLIRQCDIVKIHSDHYFEGCYLLRNRYMIHQSQRLITVYDGRTDGSTAISSHHVRGRELRIIWS